MFQLGSLLTRSTLVSHLQAALQSAGVSPAAYTGHSFCIGADMKVLTFAKNEKMQFLFETTANLSYDQKC